MKKFFCVLCAALFLTAGMALHAQAAQNDIAEGYGMGDCVYVFLEPGQEEMEGQDIQLILNGVRTGSLKSPVRMENSGQRVHYFLLVDRSTSMKRTHAETVREFAAALFEETDVKKTVSLLSFGDAFVAEAERLIDEDAVLKELSDISFDEKRSNLYQGIWSALDYIELQKREPGELFSLIVLTDGALYEASEKPDLAQVQERIAGTRELLFGMLGLGDWEKEDARAFEMGQGVKLLSDGYDAEDAAEDMADYVNDLYTVRFETDQPLRDAFEITLLFTGTQKKAQADGLLVLDGEGAGGAVPGNMPAGSGENSDGSAGEAQAETYAAEEGEPESETPLPEPGAEGEEAESETPGILSAEEIKALLEKESAAQQESEAESEAETEGNAEGEKLRIPVWIRALGGGIVLCAAGIAAGMLLAGSKKNKRKSPKRSGAGLRMKLEVISGTCLTKKREFVLEGELLIGSGKDCGLRWEGIPEKSARIFTRDGKFYLEDLGAGETAIGGMRIYGPNRLRSRDIVSVGEIQFCFSWEEG